MTLAEVDHRHRTITYVLQYPPGRCFYSLGVVHAEFYVSIITILTPGTYTIIGIFRD